MARPPMQPDPGISPFADRLNRLFELIHPEDRAAYVSREVHEALADAGVPLSISMLSMIRKGERKPPGVPVVNGLAEFFRVPLRYFDVSAGPDPAAAAFGEKLRMLIETLHEPDRAPDTSAQIAEGLRKMGAEIPVNRVLVLRHGLDAPERRELAALAAYFGVAEDFFAPDADTDAQRDAMSVLTGVRQLKIRQMIACTENMSEAQLAVALDILRSLGSMPSAPDPAPAPSNPGVVDP